MDRSKLQTLFQTLTGCSDQELVAKKTLLDLAASQVQRRLKPNVNTDEQQEILLMLAAVMAQYLDALTQATQANSVKVADITVSSEMSEQLAQLKTLKEEVLALAAPLLLDDEFVFVLA